MILILLAALAHQPAAETPRTFLQRVYAAYSKPDFSPLERPAAFFAPALTAAIREDELLAKGEVGYLDGDPLCDCQDYGRVAVRIDSLQMATRSAATAKVHVDLGGGETRDLRLDLLRTQAGWRIADVTGADHHSLLREL